MSHEIQISVRLVKSQEPHFPSHFEAEFSKQNEVQTRRNDASGEESQDSQSVKPQPPPKPNLFCTPDLLSGNEQSHFKASSSVMKPTCRKQVSCPSTLAKLLVAPGEVGNKDGHLG